MVQGCIVALGVKVKVKVKVTCWNQQLYPTMVCRTVVDTAYTHPRFPFFVTHAGATPVAPVCVAFIGPTFWPSLVFGQSQLSVPRYSYIPLYL